MFRAIGTLILIIGLSHLFSDTFSALESAAVQSLKVLETAAQSAQLQLERVE